MNYDVDSALSKLSSRRKRSVVDIRLDYDYDELKYHPFVLVYKNDNNENLLQVDHMKTICKIYNEKIKTFNMYISEEPHHLPNYIAIYNNKTTCYDITKEDVDRYANVLQECVQYYKNNQLKECLKSGEGKCQINSTICTKDLKSSRHRLTNILYNTFHYITDKSFVEDPTYLKLSTSITPHEEYTDVFKALHKAVLIDLSQTKINDIQIVAYEISNLKFQLFQNQIILQSLLIITAIVLVVVFIWIYSSSLFVGLMTLSCIIFALMVSYFVYGRVFDMDFFPFLNMVTLIFIVGIGADDAFVYTGIWEEAKHVYVINNSENHTQYLVKWTIHALRHAVLAMLVTSLTTASAFYANISSSITSVKCFGLYAGTSIIVNYLLMITLFPTVVILHDKYFARCMHSCCPTACKTRPLLDGVQSSGLKSFVTKGMSILTHYTDNFFKIYLPNVLLKLRYLWIVLFTALGIGMAVVTFGKPGLNLPTSKDFQMFTSSNSLEQYALKYKKEFFFPDNADSVRAVTVIFGANPVDNGNHFNPDDHGKLELTSDRVKIENEQTWLLDFCREVKNESFFINSQTCHSIELMFVGLQSPCIGINNRSGCCNQTIPMKPEKNFLKCFFEAVSDSGPIKDDHPVFDHSHNLRMLPITINTEYKWTEENQYNDRMYKELNRWFDKQKETLREVSMTDGWWFADLTFYDLQISLFKGTKQSLGKPKNIPLWYKRYKMNLHITFRIHLTSSEISIFVQLSTHHLPTQSQQ